MLKLWLNPISAQFYSLCIQNCAVVNFIKIFSLLCVPYRRGPLLLTFMDCNFVCDSYIEIISLPGCYTACIRLRRLLFGEWEVVERVDLKIDGMYQVQDSLHHQKYIIYIYVYIFAR